MHVKLIQNSITNVSLLVVVDKEMISQYYNRTVEQLARTINVPGFRKGNVPITVAAKHLNDQSVQSDFLENIMNDVYINALKEVKITPANQPNVSIKKFVPYDNLELEYKVDVIGEIKLANLSTLKTKKEFIKVKPADINKIVEDLREKEAEKKEVKRPAKLKDEVVFDFEGIDPKTKETIAGAKSEDYSLVLGSKSFIPGFEEELVGLKKDDKKEFKITFPADYHAAELKSKLVLFKIYIKSVQELVLPEINKKFIEKLGPFKSLEDLKKAISDQLQQENDKNSKQIFDNKIVEELVEKSTVELPDSLVESELDRVIEADKRNVLMNGQTFEQHLKNEGVDEQQHRESNRKLAITQIKAGLILSKIATEKGIKVTDQELFDRLSMLRQYYANDEAMIKELDNKDNQLDIKNRMMVEKTLDFLEKEQAKSK